MASKVVDLIIDMEAKGLISIKKGGAGLVDIEKKAGKTDKALKNFGKTSEAISKKLKTFALGATGMVTALAVSTKAALSSADNIAKTSDKIGITTKSFQELTLAASLTGVSQGTLESSMARFTKRIGEAAQGTGAAAKVYAQLGISVKNADGSIRNIDSILNDVANKIQGMSTEAEKAAAISAIFGREGMALALTLKDGAVGLDQYRAKANQLGIVIDEKLLRQSESANDAMDMLGRTIKAGVTTELLKLAPTIQVAAESLLQFMPVISGVLDILLQFAPVLIPLIAGLGGFSIAWITLINPITKIIALVGGGSGLLSVLGALGTALGPITLLVAAFWAGWKVGEFLAPYITRVFMAIPNAISSAVGKAISILKGFWQSVKNIAAGIAATVRQIFSLKAQVASGGGGGGGAPVRKRYGGRLPGYGGGDRIRALLEAGEFVVRKEAVRKYGTGMMNAINGMKIPSSAMKFQTGGIVPKAQQSNTFNFSAPINASGGNAQALDAMFRQSIIPQFKEALRSNTGSITTALRRYV